MREKRHSADTEGAAFLISRIVARAAFYVLVILLAVFLSERAFTFGYSVFHSNPMTGKPGRDIAVTVTEGMSAKEVGELLESKSLIRDADVFAVQAGIYNYRIYPGTYVLNTSETIAEMAAVLSQEQETGEEKSGSALPLPGQSGGSYG